MAIIRLTHGVARQITTQDPATGADVTQLGDATNNALRVNVVASGAGAGAGVPIYDGYQSPVAVAWTSATAQNTASTVTTSGYDTAVVSFVPSGSITAGVITFEVFDGAAWLPLKAARIESYNTEGSYTLTGGTRGWQIPVAGFPQFRVRLSTAITGTGTAALTIIISSAPDTSVVTVGLDPSQPLPAGTNVLGGVAGDTAAGTADSGNPVKAGGVASTSAPAAATNGQRQNIWLGANGQLVISGTVLTGADGIGISAAEVSTAGGSSGFLGNLPYLTNGAGSRDLQRNNVASTPLALSAATKATRTSATQTNFNGRGITLAVTLANKAGTPTITPSIVEVFASGATSTIWSAAAALSANGTAVYQIYPGISGGSFTEKISAAVGRSFQVVLTYAGNGTTDAVDTTADVDIIL